MELSRQQRGNSEKWPQSELRKWIGIPDIVTGQTDMLPAERRNVSGQLPSGVDTTVREIRQRCLQIAGIPKVTAATSKFRPEAR